MLYYVFGVYPVDFFKCFIASMIEELPIASYHTQAGLYTSMSYKYILHLRTCEHLVYSSGN